MPAAVTCGYLKTIICEPVKTKHLLGTYQWKDSKEKNPQKYSLIKEKKSPSLCQVLCGKFLTVSTDSVFKFQKTLNNFNYQLSPISLLHLHSSFVSQ